MVDLPSFSSALVTMIVRAPRSRFTNSRFARSMRNASASPLCGLAIITSRFLRRSALGGAAIRASSVVPSLSPISVAERTRVSRASRAKASPIPSMRPSITPSTTARFVRGWICAAPLAGRRSEAFAVCSASIVRSACSFSASRATRGEESLNPLCSSSVIRPRSSLRAAMIDAVSSSRRCADELLCVDRRKLCGRLGVAVGDVEVQDVRIGRRSDACAAEERAGVSPGILAASTTRFATSGDIAICVCVWATRCGSW